MRAQPCEHDHINMYRDVGPPWPCICLSSISYPAHCLAMPRCRHRAVRKTHRVTKWNSLPLLESPAAAAAAPAPDPSPTSPSEPPTLPSPPSPGVCVCTSMSTLSEGNTALRAVLDMRYLASISLNVFSEPVARVCARSRTREREGGGGRTLIRTRKHACSHAATFTQTQTKFCMVSEASETANTHVHILQRLHIRRKPATATTLQYYRRRHNHHQKQPANQRHKHFRP